MPVTFNLTVTITGESLNEIDEGLMKAAGERLQARLAKPIGGVNVKGPEVSTTVTPPTAPLAEAKVAPPKPILPTVQRHEAPAEVVPEPVRRKQGRPPGTRYPDGYKKPLEVVAEVAPVAEEATIAEPVAEMPKQEQVTAPAAEEPSAADVATALKALNSAKGMEKAREVIALFNVARSSELSPDQRRPFIQKCHEMEIE